MKNSMTKLLLGIGLCASVSFIACDSEKSPGEYGGEHGEGSINTRSNDQTSDPDNNYNHTTGNGNANGSGSTSGTGSDSTGVNPAYENYSGSTTSSSTTGNGTTGTNSGTTTNGGTTGTTRATSGTTTR